ncbi:MAG: DUF2891 domain-containing protein [Bacteroidota bacterium]
MKFILFLLVICIFSCSTEKKETKQKTENKSIDLNLEQANRLVLLPFKCIEQEFPNKLGQVLNNKEEIRSPKDLHPIFYGCFDWHSSVHGHWLMISLLKRFPNLDKANEIRALLNQQFTEEKIKQEIAFFETKFNDSFERTYGWAWILKLQEELDTWEDKDAKNWAKILKPMSEMLVEKYITFLPKMIYPIRSGEHINTAFGLSFAYDYAKTSSHDSLKLIIEKRAKDFYLKDQNYPLSFEPSGYDFLSPTFQEIDLMRKVLSKSEFNVWLDKFLPSLKNKKFSLEVGKVGDRSDGKLVHLDGLNFSRAWCMYELADYNPKYKHLRKIADKHLDYSIKSIVDGDYMGEHWLASFAVYALLKK